MEEYTENKLVADACTGNKEAFGLLVARHQQTLQRVAARLIDDPDQAQECVQAALLQACLSIDTLRDRDRFKSWLCGIVRNVCLRHIRHQKIVRFPLDAEHVNPHPNPNPHETTETRDTRRHLWRAIHMLSPKNQDVVHLFYFEGLTLREISNQLRISIAAVKGRLHKSRQQLQNHLTTHYPEFTFPTPPRRHPMKTKTDLHCAFCSKKTEEVPYLVTGPGVNICSQCVTLCMEVLQKHGIPMKGGEKS